MPSQSLLGSGLLQPLPHQCGGHHQFQLHGSCSVWVWYPCLVEVCIVQWLLVSSWLSYTWPSSVPFCHMLGIGSPLQGRKLILGHAILCSSCRSVVVSATDVEVCVPCIDLSAGVLCGWCGRSWSCLVPRLPFCCWWHCEFCIPLTS